MIKCNDCGKELYDRFEINIIDLAFFCDECYKERLKELEINEWYKETRRTSKRIN